MDIREIQDLIEMVSKSSVFKLELEREGFKLIHQKGYQGLTGTKDKYKEEDPGSKIYPFAACEGGQLALQLLKRNRLAVDINVGATFHAHDHKVLNVGLTINTRPSASQIDPRVTQESR